MRTKTDLLIDHLQTGEPITKAMAKEMGIKNLSASIYDLKRMGLEVEKDKTTDWPVKPDSKWEVMYWVDA